ncbi:ParB/RepB/Spo0J family partition protein [Micromonospora sp. RV43]|uniref:ParB/RepB/Spo0J family partition protein n=1 Tax=Micromonospora sp. RV43 TaxID=1661387 RepID=UPI0009E52D1F|nr:ParB/RepB/Spo0J family partition protein [Micromonospora sp. RV43]
MRPVSAPVADVVTHPANPRKNLGDLSELEASIREVGVIQPPVVLPAARVAAAWPAHADKLAGAQWVVLVGARRRTAAGRVYGDDPDATLNVLVREDAIADDPLAQLDVMTAENVARAPLSPVEEARAFAEQEAAGRTQRDIAQKVGCSQSHVSKRLKLLKLPEVLLAELETGQSADDDQEQPDGKKKPTLQIKDALAFVDAAGSDQELMLAAYRMRDDRRHHWTPAQLVNQVRSDRERQETRDAAKKKLAAEGVPVIDSAYQQFGDRYAQRRLDGAKAVAKARKDGALVAEVNTYGQVSYYSTAGKPKAADNRTPAEQQRITDERERRKAMTARFEAAAVLAAQAPKLPKAAEDIIDAWLWAPGNECAQLAQKWLRAAGVGPDPNLPNYQWWEQIRRADWNTRVHAAHALGIARREVQTRTTYRTWNQNDATWLARLVKDAGYTPSEWEQARLDAIEAPESEPAAGQPEPGEQANGPQRVSLVFDDGGACCWLLFYDSQVQKPAAYAQHLKEAGNVDAAQAWAAELLTDRHGIKVTGWTDGQFVPGQPARIAVRATDTSTATAGPVGEWRLLHDPVDDAWLLLADDKPHADHDGLAAADVDQACQWATGVMADADVVCHGWTARAGGNATLEYVADLTGEC